MKRTLAVAMMIALAPLAAGAGTLGVITGTMRGPSGPMAGVKVNVLDTTGTIVGSATTSGTGAYALDGLPPGTFVVQAVSPAGTVLGTSLATLSGERMQVKTNLAASAAAAPAAQSAAVTSTNSSAVIWWIVGASAATAGIISAVALDDDPSPVQ